jgi:hypothetical protein
MVCELRGHAFAQSLRHYGISREVAASKPDEVNEFFSIHLILPSALGSGVYAASNRNVYQKQKIMFVRSKTRPVRRPDNPADICELIV